MSPTVRASQIAGEAMKSGNNCCQSVLIAASRVWDLPLSPELVGAAALFGQGMGSGCTCGALTGMIMASGLRKHTENIEVDNELAPMLHDHFKKEFGSTCCRALRKKQGIFERMGQRACNELTSRAAAMLIDDWEAYTDGSSGKDIGNYSYPQ